MKPLSELTGSDIAKMTDAELQELMRKVQKAVIQKKRRLEKAGMEWSSPAYDRAKKEHLFDPMSRKKKKWGKKSEGKEPSKALQRGRTMEDIRKGMEFVRSPSSGVRGAKALHKEFERKLGQHMSKRLTKKFWEIYNILADRFPWLGPDGSDRIQECIKHHIHEWKTAEKIAEEVEEEINAEYEKRESQGGDDTGFDF